MASSVGKPLRILIVSANLGNAEPSPSSIAACIPNDGLVVEVTNHTFEPHHYMLPDGDREDYFDIIAIGMQEAAFNTKEEKRRHKQKRIVSVQDTSEISNDENSPTNSDRDNYSEENESGKNKREWYSTGKKKVSQVLRPTLKPLNSVSSQVRSVTQSEDHTKKPPERKLVKRLLRKKTKMPEFFPHDKINPAAYYGGDTKTLQGLISARCPSYGFPVQFMRGEMRLYVLVRDDLMPELENVDCRAKNTGIGSILANKGGIVCTITIRNTHLSFITAHLEAHEGSEHYINRCSNMRDILGAATVGPFPRRRYDASISSHHCFVCGDLNYRVALPSDQGDSGYDSVTNNSRKPKDAHIEEVRNMVEEEDWYSLNKADELAKALAQRDCLVGFRTLPCLFPPTFKVKRGDNGFVYDKKRTPSYTDRILWKSLDGLEGNLLPFAYEPCPSFITSDHKPIRGAFSVVTNSGEGFNKDAEMDDLQELCSKIKLQKRLHIFVSDITCTGLDLSDTGKKSDPYVMFVTDPAHLLHKPKEVKKKDSPFRMGSKRSSEIEEVREIKKKRSQWPRTMKKKKDKVNREKKRKHSPWPRTSRLKKTLNPDW